MRSRASFLAATLLSAHAVLPVGAQESSNGPVDVPAVDKFVALIGGRVAVIGSRVYYDGGFVHQLGSAVDYDYHGLPLNSTLSIDLSRSWSSETVVIDETPRPRNRPPVMYQSLWTNKEDGTFYIWGGTSLSKLPAAKGLRKFTPGDEESDWGSWTDVRMSSQDESTLGSISHNPAAVSVSTQDAAFIFGNDEATGNDNYSYFTFNFSTEAWKVNIEPDPLYKEIATTGYSQGVFAPMYGPNGLIFILGGERRPSPTELNLVELDTIHFFDPVGKRWFAQDTTGDIPSPASGFCAVGVAGGNGTFDIFVYAGARFIDEVSSNDSVSVLSLPGFRWTRLHKKDNPDSLGRSAHECAVIGRRHLLSWGGSTSVVTSTEVDAHPRGLAVFDMSEGEWKDGFDADAAEYRAHPRVTAYQTEEEYQKIKWLSEDAKALFERDPADSQSPDADDSGGSGGTGNSGGTGGTGGTGDEEDGNPNDPSGSPSSLPVGAIVGGVVGGVVVIAGLVIAFCMYRRRKHRQLQQLQAALGQQNTAPEGKGTPVRHDTTELDGNAVSEMGRATDEQYRKAHAVEVHGDSAYYHHKGDQEAPRELDAR